MLDSPWQKPRGRRYAPGTDGVTPGRSRNAAPRSSRSKAEVVRNPLGDGRFDQSLKRLFQQCSVSRNLGDRSCVQCKQLDIRHRIERSSKVGVTSAHMRTMPSWSFCIAIPVTPSAKSRAMTRASSSTRLSGALSYRGRLAGEVLQGHRSPWPATGGRPGSTKPFASGSGGMRLHETLHGEALSFDDTA